MTRRTWAVVGVASGFAMACICVACAALGAFYPMPPSYYATRTARAWATRSSLPTGTPFPTNTPSPTHTPVATPTSPHITHVVQSGDTLSGIAAHFGTTAEAIMELNGLTSTIIYSGTQLLIPTGDYVASPAPSTPSAEPMPEDLIVDVPSILEKSAEEVQHVLGGPVEAFPAGELAAGEWHVFQVGPYLIDVIFDRTGVAKELSLGASYEGLQEEGYRLDSSVLRLLDRLGMTAHLSQPEPDKEIVSARGVPMAWHWYDSNGYLIIVFAEWSSPYRVWQVQIRR